MVHYKKEQIIAIVLKKKSNSMFKAFLKFCFLFSKNNKVTVHTDGMIWLGRLSVSTQTQADRGQLMRR